MSNIRRQSIVSSILIYIGFAFGALNTYLFIKEGGLTQEQYGLTGAFMAIGSMIMALATLGMPGYINKFYPYYKDRLNKEENDLATWAITVSIIGFILVAVAGLFLKGLVNKVYANSPLLVSYYYWIFPFGLGLTLFAVLEALAWHNHKSILSNFLKEVQFRVFVTILFICLSLGVVSNFDQFIKAYSFLYLLLALILVVYLFSSGRIRFTFKVSKVTRRFLPKIATLSGFIWGGALVYTAATVSDTIIIMAILPEGVKMAGLFTFAQYLTSIIQAPQRSIIAASVAHLSQSWKNKDMKRINHIYQRSSINQLIFSLAVFCLIFINYKDAIMTFPLQKDYLAAMNVFVLMGIVKIIDMGTGVSGQIIATSTYWRFDFITGIILLVLMLPLSWILTRHLGITGPAIANLFAFTVYNLIRYLFLLNKFNMQPFTWKSLYALLLGGICFVTVYFLFRQQSGVLWMITRSMVFLILFVSTVYYFNLSPDIKPVLASLRGKPRSTSK